MLTLYIQLLQPAKLKRIKDMVKYVEVNIYRNSDVSPRVYKVCDEYAAALLKNVISTEFILLFSCLLFVMIPAYMILYDRGHHMFFFTAYPFTDPATDRGYYINLVHQSVTLITGVPALIGVEISFCLAKNAILVTAGLIIDSIQTLDENLDCNQEFTNKRAWEMRNLTLKFQDFDK